jgi:hypothetical protein
MCRSGGTASAVTIISQLQGVGKVRRHIGLWKKALRKCGLCRPGGTRFVSLTPSQHLRAGLMNAVALRLRCSREMEAFLNVYIAGDWICE